VEVVYRSSGRPAVLDVPRRQWPRELALGIGVALILFALRWLARKYRAGVICWGMTNSLLGLFFGIMGSLLFFMTFFTKHDYTYHNANVLFVNPLLLAAVPLGFIFAFGKAERKRFLAGRILTGLWTYVFSGGVLTMLIKLLPGFYQQNQVTQALLLPIAFALSSITGYKVFFHKEAPPAASRPL
jgi:hypothetical protein